MNRYNIALVPTDEKLHDILYRAAKAVATWQDGYILNAETAKPHVTLCQFYAESDEAAKTLTQDFEGRELEVVNSGLYAQSGVTGHEGKTWFGYITERRTDLLDLEEAVVRHLTAHNVKMGWGAPRDIYFPHFTIARLAQPLLEISKDFYTPAFLNTPISVRARLGHCDENGRFLGYVA